MEKTPFEIFLNIGKELCNETDFTQNQNIILTNPQKTKTYEEYKNNYKSKLELYIADNKKMLDELDKEILELERKISEILRLYCNKKISSNSLSLVYTNRPIIKYLNSLNSLENEKMRYYYLTLQNLKAQHELYTLILNKNYVLWNKINNT
jgi:hypothetical protein